MLCRSELQLGQFVCIHEIIADREPINFKAEFFIASTIVLYVSVQQQDYFLQFVYAKQFPLSSPRKVESINTLSFIYLCAHSLLNAIVIHGVR